MADAVRAIRRRGATAPREPCRRPAARARAPIVERSASPAPGSQTGSRRLRHRRRWAEEQAGDRDRGDAVDQRVVGLADERERAVAGCQAIDEAHPPQRPVGGQRAETAARPRPRAAHPHRPAPPASCRRRGGRCRSPGRRPRAARPAPAGQLPAKARDRVQPRFQWRRSAATDGAPPSPPSAGSSRRAGAPAASRDPGTPGPARWGGPRRSHPLAQTSSLANPGLKIVRLVPFKRREAPNSLDASQKLPCEPLVTPRHGCTPKERSRCAPPQRLADGRIVRTIRRPACQQRRRFVVDNCKFVLHASSAPSPNLGIGHVYGRMSYPLGFMCPWAPGHICRAFALSGRGFPAPVSAPRARDRAAEA